MLFDKLKLEEPYHGCDFKGYRFDDIKTLPGEVVIIEPNRRWLWIHDDNGCVEFALFDFLSSEGDGTQIYVSNIFRGYGFNQSLREMRHIWWGDEKGYTYYLPAKAVIKALEYLSKYFD